MEQKFFMANLRRYGLLTEEHIEALRALCQEVVVKKGEVILDIGEVPRYYYYVEKGLFSYYYLTEKGEHIIKNFFPEDTFIASLSALLYQKPTLFAIQALEDSLIYKIAWDRFRELMVQQHDVALFYINYLEEHWVKAKEIAEITSKFDTAEIRYRDFIATYPHLAQRLKQHHIASYLGVTPTQLSRIHKQQKK